MYNTVINDNFFENPDEVVKFANTLKYHKSDMSTDGNFWPGERTESLNKIDEELFYSIIKKVISSYYNFEYEKVKYDGANVYFHKISKDTDLTNSKHNDVGKELAAVIYLNKENSLKTGTTICDDFSNESIKIGNQYNRMVSYDATKIHTPTGYNVSDEYRLTVTVFIENIVVIM